MLSLAVPQNVVKNVKQILITKIQFLKPKNNTKNSIFLKQKNVIYKILQ